MQRKIFKSYALPVLLKQQQSNRINGCRYKIYNNKKDLYWRSSFRKKRGNLRPISSFCKKLKRN